MTDEVSKPAMLANSDLRVLSEGAEKKVVLKDKDGVDHVLAPLVIQDLIEFEDEIGSPIFNIMNVNLGMKQVMHLLYLSLRKEGLNKDDIERKKWKYTRNQVGEMFDFSILRVHAQLFTDLLSISGLGKEENPLKQTSPDESGPKEKASTPDAAESAQEVKG